MNQTRLIPAIATQEGAGVTVNRTIGTPSFRNYDPFIMLDHFGSDIPNEYIAGFPSHPHRGFITFTYMLNGRIEHEDSMGNTGNLGPGDAQWMKAASGVIHSEMPKQENGLMRGFQLWINLPAANKMDTPEYQEYDASAFPVIETEDYQVKVIIGKFADTKAPIMDNITDVSYIDVQLKPGKSFTQTLSTEYRSFLYVFEGKGQLKSQNVPTHTFAALGANDNPFEFTAGEQGARFIFVSGKPINEPIVQYGPFVMNTRDEIDQAMQDFQASNFVRDRAWIKPNNK